MVGPSNLAPPQDLLYVGLQTLQPNKLRPLGLFTSEIVTVATVLLSFVSLSRLYIVPCGCLCPKDSGMWIFKIKDADVVRDVLKSSGLRLDGQIGEVVPSSIEGISKAALWARLDYNYGYHTFVRAKADAVC